MAQALHELVRDSPTGKQFQMADILKTSPALVSATPTATRPDETRSRDTSDSEAGAPAPAAFAALLKSRSDRIANPAAVKTSAAKDGANTGGDTLAPDATALLFLALGAAPTPDPAIGDTGGELPETSPIGLLQGDEAESLAEIASVGLTASSLVAGNSEGAAQPQTDALAQAAVGATPLAVAAPLSGAVSVAPTPTSGKPTDAPQGKATDLAWQENRPTDSPSVRPAAADKLAGGAAISAEAATTGARSTGSGENATEFRGLLDRIASHPGNLTMHSATSAQTSPAPPILKVDTGLGQAGWAQEMGDKLSWMAGNGRQQADLVLNPPQLGRIEVSMVIEGDNVSATFASANATVREALENSMSRLREVLADAGVALGDAHVGSECRHDSGPASARGERGMPGNRFDETPTAADAIVSGSPWRTSSGRGMVDVFA